MPQQPRMRRINGVEVPTSHSFRLAFCGHCPNGHVILDGPDGIPFAEMTITAAQAQNIADRIRTNDPNFKEIPCTDPSHS